VTTLPRPRVHNQLQPISPAEPEKRIVYCVFIGEVREGVKGSFRERCKSKLGLATFVHCI
jgi:hypothetical protein